MGEIGAKYNVSQAPIAIAWAIIKGTVPIIGVTKEAHIDDALSAINLKLEVKDIHALEKTAMETGISVRGAWEKSMKINSLSLGHFKDSRRSYSIGRAAENRRNP